MKTTEATASDVVTALLNDGQPAIAKNGSLI